MYKIVLIFFLYLPWSTCLLPPKFQWKTIDFTWGPGLRAEAMATGDYVPQNNMPTGLARWKDRVFITIPRWKKGVPSSLNYVKLDGSQQQPLNPYPNWDEGFVSDNACGIISNATVVSAFRPHIDSCGRLWVVDNGVSEMAHQVKQITDAAVVVFDLNTDKLLHRFVLPDEVLRDSSVMTSIVVDITKNCKCDAPEIYAYIMDMGSNGIIVYSMKDDTAWRVEHPYFHSDPQSGVYRVGGIDFYWSDGVSSATLSPARKDGHRDLYLHPTSSTKQFKISTELLRTKVSKEEIDRGVEIVGDRGPKSQATACDYDPKTNVLFFTQLSKNGVGCWNLDKPFSSEYTPCVISDCNVLEFPNDIKVDHDGNLWILSDRQSRFLYDAMDFNQVNFRILTAPVSKVIQGTPCDKKRRCFLRRKKSNES